MLQAVSTERALVRTHSSFNKLTTQPRNDRRQFSSGGLTGYDCALMMQNVPSSKPLTRNDVETLYQQGLLDLIFQASQVHREYRDPSEIQCAALLSVKTGGCPEDCAYCPQSAHYETDVESSDLMNLDAVHEAAKTAQANGADRFCMGAAWRSVSDGKEFDAVLEMVRTVKGLGLETCVTLGMLEPHQAQRLSEAGLDYYNHNLDTGPEYYDRIITTRNYQDRLRTLEHVRAAGIHLCCGGIIGMGERVEDRVGMLGVLARIEPHPESVPINALVAVAGTPLSHQPPAPSFDMVRMIATTRIVLPRSRVRLSAGRTEMSDEAQALCFLAGANSIFTGDRLLTTPNPSDEHDQTLLTKLGLTPMEGS